MKALQQIRRIHLAVSIGLAVWCALAYYYVENHKAIASFSDDIRIELGAVLWTFALVAVSQLYWRNRIRRVDPAAGLEDKLELYKRTAIIHYGLLELLVVGLAVGFAWGGQQNLLLYALMAMAYFIYHRPYPLKMIKELQLSQEQEDSLRAAFK